MFLVLVLDSVDIFKFLLRKREWVKLYIILATQSIKARAQQERYRRACTIELSINEDTKLEKGKEKRKTGGTVGLYKYLARAAKALVVSMPTVETVPYSMERY